MRVGISGTTLAAVLIFDSNSLPIFAETDKDSATTWWYGAWSLSCELCRYLQDTFRQQLHDEQAPELMTAAVETDNEDSAPYVPT